MLCTLYSAASISVFFISIKIVAPAIQVKLGKIKLTAFSQKLSKVSYCVFHKCGRIAGPVLGRNWDNAWMMVFISIIYYESE